ncbi:hypothetical protein [Shewanella marisflavi]|uniref:Leucine-rich repeat domain-containing protein n=1 Tax=Shewanella marisflavi TaxID=260364 RepID=A0AAC9U298_9GAMM|nr:hypothetical protein [Shewanella marisflavi]ASJ98083.1 hypothetical protein CFF01_16610 [Shewanella marisflavi]
MHIDFMRDKSTQMPVLDSPEQVLSARFWHCNFETLKPLSECKNIEVLIIASLPESNFDFLRDCPNLKYLSVLHLPKVAELVGLETLRNLETLSLSTLPSWDSSGKTQLVSSLEPIACLPRLKHLELFGVIPASKSPEALANCALLESVRLSKYDRKAAKQYYQSTQVSDEWAPEPVFAN